MLKQSRAELISKIKNQANFDVIIIGGGIHGAVLANLLSQQQVPVLLIEKNDYAFETSSRSSKMAHGGLRYLEMLDFKQVFEGIKCRDELFETAPHLAKPSKFLIPVSKKHSWFRFKLKIGLLLYDLFLNNKNFRHYWIDSQEIEVKKLLAKKVDGFYAYTDGLMNDSRLVIENILASREQGAICINYFEFINSNKIQNNLRTVKIKDTLANNQFNLTCKILVNCSGPWVKEIDAKAGVENKTNVKLSKGAHLIFNIPWEHPVLLLPLASKGQYYFIWPYYDKTLVGTTEREINLIESDPKPSGEEIEEILDRLKKDLPHSSLIKENIYKSFAGIRTLPIRSNSKKTANTSRRHIWCFNDLVLSLYGGKFTTAKYTATEALRLIAKKLNFKIKVTCNRLDYGKNALSNDLDIAIKHCLENEQVEKIEDLIDRRLGLLNQEQVKDLLERSRRSASF